MGFRHEIKRSTLADAAETHAWRIHAEFAQRLIVQARKLYLGESFGMELENTTYALDSTTIDLCLSLFSVGAVSYDQVGGKDAHAAGLARQYPRLHPLRR